MAAELYRRYNRTTEQLDRAVQAALAQQFPASEVREADGTLYLCTGRHKTWTSLGEQIEVSLPRPGLIKLRSFNRPWLPLIFEHGDNVANVEELACAIERHLTAQPPHCPHCGMPLDGEPPAAEAADGPPLCPACRRKLFRPQAPVPDSAAATRTATVALLLVFTLPALILIAVVVAILLALR
jgi:hypothetical protein